jgi:hypothetical protein
LTLWYIFIISLK